MISFGSIKSCHSRHSYSQQFVQCSFIYSFNHTLIGCDSSLLRYLCERNFSIRVQLILKLYNHSDTLFRWSKIANFKDLFLLNLSFCKSIFKSTLIMFFAEFTRIYSTEASSLIFSAPLYLSTEMLFRIKSTDTKRASLAAAAANKRTFYVSIKT